MAIIKEISYPQGYSATYWRIKEFGNLNIDTGMACMTVAGYLSKDIRDICPTRFVDLKTFQIAFDKASLLDGTLFEAAYVALMQDEFFQDAESDEEVENEQ